MRKKNYVSAAKLRLDADKYLNVLLEANKGKSFIGTMEALQHVMKLSDQDFNSGTAIFAAALHRLSK